MINYSSALLRPRITIMLLCLFLTGCATVTRARTQKVHVHFNTQEPQHCTITNAKGHAWTLDQSATLELPRSCKGLTLRCEDSKQHVRKIHIPAQFSRAPLAGNAAVGATGGAIAGSAAAVYFAVVVAALAHSSSVSGSTAASIFAEVGLPLVAIGTLSWIVIGSGTDVMTGRACEYPDVVNV